MHGLVKTQALDIGPVENLKEAGLARHFLRSHEAGKGDVFGRTERLHLRQQACEWKSDPRNDHRPCFDAAHPIDALFKRHPGNQVLNVEFLRLLDEAVDGELPGQRLVIAGIGGRVALVRAELVEIIVGRDGILRRQLLVHLIGGSLGLQRFGKSRRGNASGSESTGADHEGAAVEIEAFGRHRIISEAGG